ncbi:P-loop containing nucleoside triphosphate hydrolase protein [Trichophaea hybrida]|nr:P-loop containing nucleoside triphosphate hydrolase protein [Trichophaea hybrida]
MDHTTITTDQSVLDKGKKRKRPFDEAQDHAEPGMDGRCDGEAGESVSEEMRVEVKNLEERIEMGSKFIREPPRRAARKPVSTEQWSAYVLAVTRHFNDDNKFSHRTLEINSPLIKSALKELIGDYPGQSYNTDKISVLLPAWSLFHYLPELKTSAILEGEEINDYRIGGKMPENVVVMRRKHLRCLVSWLDVEFRETLRDMQNLLSENLISYQLLWTIFKPGTLVYTTIEGQPQILRLIRANYSKPMLSEEHFSLQGWYIDYDGKTYGSAKISVEVAKFSESKKIHELDGFPLIFHPEEPTIRMEIIERGKRFHSFKGQHYCEYKGIALGVKQQPSFFERSKERIRYDISGRIIVDNATFKRFNPSARTSFTQLSSKEIKPTHEGILSQVDGEEEYLLAPATVAGFSLREKVWVEFYIDNITSVAFNDHAFEHLVLPSKQKKLVKALVEEHSKDQNSFDDVINGKGKGLIIILHGPPGVGKTLTAESVAEHTQRPLYVVSSGDLGTSASDVDSKLSWVLDLVSTWNAILLLDEADVFLEERSLNDLNRNALVSIFLRQLEYFQGILFLTTNRVKTFDAAFQSRIHVALKFSNLDFEARCNVWSNFRSQIQHKIMTDGLTPAVNFGEEDCQVLAQRVMNGREIKNAMATAKILAANEGKVLTLDHVTSVLDIQEEFKKELGP